VAEVDEVTVPTSLARAFVELATTCVREISDGAVFGRHDTPGVVASGHGLQTSLGLLFLVILDVDVAEHVITQILYCVQLLNLTKLLELFQQFLRTPRNVPRGQRWAARWWDPAEAGCTSGGSSVFARSEASSGSSSSGRHDGKRQS